MGRGIECSGLDAGPENDCVIRALLGWFIGGSVLATLAFTLLAVGALVLGLLYRRYLHFLGADRNDPGARQAYDGLRDSFAQGDVALRLNAKRSTRLLNWTDHFFGDASLADHTLFPHAFGLKTPAPLWTAPAFDRCLLLALVYAVMVAILIWTISGSTGAAEQALHLAPHATGWVRLATVVSLGALVRAALHLRPFTGCLWAVIFIVISGLAAGLATAGVITGPGASELVQWSVVGAIAAVAYPPGGAVTFAFGFLIAVGLVSEGPVTVAGSLAVVGSIVFAFAVRWANSTPIWRQRQGTFLIAFFRVCGPGLSCRCRPAILLTKLECYRPAGVIFRPADFD
jgi:hypothetical protein